MNEFLIVDDNVLGMPDCTLSIRSLSDSEIEIELDQTLKRNVQDTDVVNKTKQDEGDAHEEEPQEQKEGSAESQMDTEQVPKPEVEETVIKPKIKIGSGKPVQRKRNNPKTDSESDTPRYSMQIRPTPRRISTGRQALRNQKAKNYQEMYDYSTGRCKDKQKKDIIPPALSEPTEARQAAQGEIKNVALLGATPTRTIPVLRLTAADDSDNTIVYDKDDVPDNIPDQPDDTQGSDTSPKDLTPTPSKSTDKNNHNRRSKSKGSLQVKRYVIRTQKKKRVKSSNVPNAQTDMTLSKKCDGLTVENCVTHWRH